MEKATFEEGLALIKSKLDGIDGQIKVHETKIEELKPYVRDHGTECEKRNNLKKQRKSVFHTLTVLTEFYKETTGVFPDGMFPLFAKENTETKEPA